MMISRNDYEEAVKDVRGNMLSKTRDPETRRNVAAIIDATTDKLFEALEMRDFFNQFN